MHLRFLVVDDNEDAAATLTELLRSMEHVAEYVIDPLEAVRIAPHFRPHVALLDIGMPNMDGWDLCRALKRTDPTLQCFAISGYGTASDVKRSALAGFDAHYLKPVGFEILSGIVERAVRFTRPS